MDESGKEVLRVGIKKFAVTTGCNSAENSSSKPQSSQPLKPGGSGKFLIQTDSTQTLQMKPTLKTHLNLQNIQSISNLNPSSSVSTTAKKGKLQTPSFNQEIIGIGSSAHLNSGSINGGCEE
jgi:hypothetical protein